MPFINSFSINTDKQNPFPFNIPAVRFAKQVRLDSRVTIFVGDNGSGKSTSKQLSLIAFILDVLKMGGSQFIIASHSPILMGIPGAMLYEIQEDGMQQVKYKETDHYRITRTFLDNPEYYLRHLQ